MCGLPSPPEAGKVAELASLWLVGNPIKINKNLFNMILVYVIKSQKNKFRYVGITDNLERRLLEHNSGKNTSTSFYKPFGLIYTESHQDYKEARKREKFLKSGQGRKFLDTL